MTFVLPDLPYGYGALAPHVSADTLHVHHGEHHRAYVAKVNELVRGTDLAGHSLSQIVRYAAERGSRALFNNAAQALNHQFYWQSMRPLGGGRPKGVLNAWIVRDFGCYETFVQIFAAAAAGQFGSGWAWLVLDAGQLKIIQSSNGDTPIIHGQVPLITIDVWEHAYYLDYQNRRAEYVAAFVEHLIDWDFATSNLEGAHEGVRGTAPDDPSDDTAWHPMTVVPAQK